MIVFSLNEQQKVYVLSPIFFHTNSPEEGPQVETSRSVFCCLHFFRQLLYHIWSGIITIVFNIAWMLMIFYCFLLASIQLSGPVHTSEISTSIRKDKGQDNTMQWSVQYKHRHKRKNRHEHKHKTEPKQKRFQEKIIPLCLKKSLGDVFLLYFCLFLCFCLFHIVNLALVYFIIDLLMTCVIVETSSFSWVSTT